MGSRLTLDQILRNLLGTTNVYFQPPETIKMSYPCIVYERASGDTKFADDIPYIRHKKYNVTVIDRDPDSEIPDRVATLPMCVFDRHFTSDNLHHDVYVLYY